MARTLQELRSDEDTKEFIADLTEPHFGGECNCDGCYLRCDPPDNCRFNYEYEPRWELSGFFFRGDGWVVHGFNSNLNQRQPTTGGVQPCTTN